MTILIGCSGWSYDDWVGGFYPPELAKRKGVWLEYYARYFPTVEINSTFYHPPGERQVASWVRKGSRLENFEYSLKMPQSVTHEHMVRREWEEAVREAAAFERSCIKPLDEAGLLGSVLMQLSPFFPKNEANLETLICMLDSLSFLDYSYSVEFRHPSWLNEEGTMIYPPVAEVLSDRSVAQVLIDGPGPHIHKGGGAGHAYIRFHGRNYDIWYQGGEKKKEDDFRLNRYDYLYSIEQLGPWIPRIREAELNEQVVRVYFNNHARSKAAKNALQLMDLLHIPHEAKEIRLQDQFTLGCF